MIRRLRFEDIGRFVEELAIPMHAEGRCSHVPFDRNHYRRFLEFILENFDKDFHGFVSVAKDGSMKGGILCSVTPHDFSPIPRATDMGFYVRKEFRGSPIAVRLVRKYEEWSSLKGVDKENTYVSTSNGHKSTPRFFNKMGYKEVGYIFCKGD